VEIRKERGGRRWIRVGISRRIIYAYLLGVKGTLILDRSPCWGTKGEKAYGGQGGRRKGKGGRKEGLREERWDQGGGSR